MQLLTYLIWPQVPINCSHRINSKSNVIESVTLKNSNKFSCVFRDNSFYSLHFAIWAKHFTAGFVQMVSKEKMEIVKEYNNFRWRQYLKLVSFKLLFYSVRQENVIQSVLRDYFLFFLTNSIITLHCSCCIYLSSLRHSFQQKSSECIRIERALYKCISLIVSFRKCTIKALALI